LIYTKKDEETINVINKISEKFSTEVETFVTSRACEITLKGYNKGTMVKRIANSLNYEDNEVAVIGDDINDVTMFKMFENSFVMSHANDEVKKYAKNIIVNFKDIKQML
jgi:hydroxymethylpyrimidine pyrophosphatase-like HAD family hydrolase